MLSTSFSPRLIPASVALGLALLALSPGAAQSVPANVQTLRKAALAEVNASRETEGLSGLGLSEPLNEAAQAHAADMARRGYFAHVSPEGLTIADRFEAAGGSPWRLTAENIGQRRGAGADEAVVRDLHQGWMESPGHRENILKPGLDSFGYGLARAEDGTLYAVQTFSGAGVSRGGEGGVALGPQEQSERALARINEVREAESIAALRRDSRLDEAARALARRSQPDPDGGSPPTRGSADLFEAVPAEAQGAFRSLDAFTAVCGGCGTRPVPGDVAAFLDDWLSQSRTRERLLDASATHLGFALHADGEGRKAAVLVLAMAR